jgi:hypothetical protein
MTAAVDVLMPAHDAAATIRDSIESLRRQTFADIRIRVVDDGSTDATPAILDELAAADRRIEVLRQPKGGIVAALNAGLARCRAPLVARLDADDIAVPERLALQHDFLGAHADVVAVSGAVRHVDEAGHPTGTIGRLPDPARADPLWVPAIEPYLIHPFVMARRDALQAVGAYRDVRHAEDSDLYWRLAERGRLHNMAEVLGDYRLHGASISGASIANGRVMAVQSQLAALSAVRRLNGSADLDFSTAATAARLHASTLADLVALAARDLTPEERARLEVMAAAKLLETAAYRPYELEAEDCRFIGEAVARHAVSLRPENAARLARSLSGTAARLLHKGRIHDAAALRPGRPVAVALRLAARVMLPPTARSVLRRWRSRSGDDIPVK